jgi:hypothetical protein
MTMFNYQIREGGGPPPKFFELGLDIPAVLLKCICFKPKVTPDFGKSDFCLFYSPSKLGSGACLSNVGGRKGIFGR